jgi:zinc/manganese transport system ATP-binding protein
MISLTDLTLSHQRHPAVHHVSGQFLPGSLTAIVGPNGAGKTTLLRALAGLHPVDSGRIDRGDLKPRDIALMPQSAQIDLRFPLDCLTVVTLAHTARAGMFRGLTGAERDAARQALARVGLQGFERRGIGTLSAGQLQRLLFARAITQDAPMLLLDEPFSAVDERTLSDLLRIVAGWHQHGRTVIVVLHDLTLVRAFFPRTLLLAREPIGWGPTAEVLTEANLSRAKLATVAWSDQPTVCQPAIGAAAA